MPKSRSSSSPILDSNYKFFFQNLELAVWVPNIQNKPKSKISLIIE
jgi:hypothetical protein